MKARTYKEGDEKELWLMDRRLEVHPWNRRELSNWGWKYTQNNPSGSSYVWLMEDNDKLIAHFAAVPYRLKVFDEEIIASHSIGAMVEPEYQNRGIIKFLGDKLFEELSENNIPFTYGFPNNRSYMLHKMFMGYSDLILFDTWRIAGESIRKKDVPSFTGIKKFDVDFDKLWMACRDGYKILVVRDKAYLNWRYLERPDWEYFPFAVYKDGILKGYTALKLYRENNFLRGHLLDIFAKIDDKDTFSDIIDGSLNFFYQKGADEVTCWLWGNACLEGVMADKGFLKQETKKPLVIRFNNKFKYEDAVRDNSNWYFTMGDSTEIF